MSLDTIIQINREKLENEKKIVEHEISIYEKNASFQKDNSDLEEPEIESIVESLELAQNNSEIKANLQSYLNQIKKALVKINEGKYGTCESCGKEINRERLEVDPSAILCLNCSLIEESEYEAS